MNNKRGFTLVELLAVLVVLSVLAVIATPIVQTTLKNNKQQTYIVFVEQLENIAKDYLYKHSDEIPNDNETKVISLEELKKEGLLQIDVKNPNTGNIVSNQSYINVTGKGNNYEYDVNIFDLTDADKIEEGAPSITLNGNQIINLSVGEEYVEYGTTNDDVSIQIISENREVSSIDTSQKGTYTIYYSLEQNNKIGINIRTVIIR